MLIPSRPRCGALEDEPRFPESAGSSRPIGYLPKRFSHESRGEERDFAQIGGDVSHQFLVKGLAGNHGQSVRLYRKRCGHTEVQLIRDRGRSREICPSRTLGRRERPAPLNSLHSGSGLSPYQAQTCRRPQAGSRLRKPASDSAAGLSPRSSRAASSLLTAALAASRLLS